jgi:hypothetical protein
VVFDKNNWECLNERMVDGDYHLKYIGLNTSLDEKNETTYLPTDQQIPASAYYIHSIINFFK